MNSRKSSVPGPQKRRAAAAAVCLLFAVTALCAAGGGGGVEPALSDLFGVYVFDSVVYSNPFTSFVAIKDYMPTYELTEDRLIIEELDGEREEIPAEYAVSEVDEAAFLALLFEGPEQPDVTRYKTRRQYTLNEGTDTYPLYRLYVMDEEVWLAKLSIDGDTIWSIYRLVKPENKERV